ncbi:hypothetical protein FRC03_007110 [Tulasnella sp. 419]|nr:hypothetical protein FRC03_007110 [Tulasnella sp. 419]
MGHAITSSKQSWQDGCDLVVLYQPSSHKLSVSPQQFQTKNNKLSELLNAASLVSKELGPLASHQFWRRSYQSGDFEGFSPHDLKDVNAFERQLDENVKAAMFRLEKGLLSPEDFSFKFLKLVETLDCFSSQKTEFVGMIIVGTSEIADALYDLIQTPQVRKRLDFLRPSKLRQFSSDGVLDRSKIYKRLDCRTTNLLIATNIAEDGLDFPPLTCVVRWDMLHNHMGYAHLKSHCRPLHHFIILAEISNIRHRRITHSLAKLDHTCHSWIRNSRSSWRIIPPPELLNLEAYGPCELTKDEFSTDSSQEDGQLIICDPVSGIKIGLPEVPLALYLYASLQKRNEASDEHPLFTYTEDEATITCTVNVYTGTSLQTFSSPKCHSKAEARILACYEACKELQQLRLLDSAHIPSLSTLLASEEVTSVPPESLAKDIGTRRYTKRASAFWKNSLDASLEVLYPTVLTIFGPASPDDKMSDNISTRYRPICVFTRLPLPKFLPFQVFIEQVSCTAHLKRFAKVSVTEQQLQALRAFSVGLLRCAANKPFACHLDETVCLLGPILPAWRNRLPEEDEGHPFPNINDLISWDEIARAMRKEERTVPLPKDTKFLKDCVVNAVIKDQGVEFTRRYLIQDVREDLSPLSHISDNEVYAGYTNVEEYYSKNSRSYVQIRDMSQPLLEAVPFPSLLSHLDPPRCNGLPTELNMRYLIPELCQKSFVAADILWTGLILPSIFRRMDDIMVAMELNAKFFGNSIDISLLETALTASSATMSFDYERLEFLGDAFLKFLASFHVFVMHPGRSEGSMHTIRQKIISNKVLLQASVQSGLTMFINSTPFIPRTWIPPGFYLQLPRSSNAGSNTTVGPENRPSSMAINMEEEDSDDAFELPQADASAATFTGEPDIQSGISSSHLSNYQKIRQELSTHWLGDKCVADTVESIIGAAYLTGGKEAALSAALRMNIPLSPIFAWSDFAKHMDIQSESTQHKLSASVLESIEEIVGVRFSKPYVLAQALTHVSASGNPGLTYERLEFLGDAVLDCLVISDIYKTHETLTPGEMSVLKSAMVSNTTLAAICMQIKLYQHLQFDSMVLGSQIEQYRTKLEEHQHREYTDAAAEGRQPGQYWLDIEPPKVLSDMIEAIFGAIVVSEDFDSLGSEVFYSKVIKPFLDKHISWSTICHHPTKLLLELLQSRSCREFMLPKQEDGPLTRCEVIYHNVILSSEVGFSSSEASRLASARALDALEGDPTFLDRICDCREVAERRRSAKRLKLDTKSTPE